MKLKRQHGRVFLLVLLAHLMLSLAYPHLQILSNIANCNTAILEPIGQQVQNSLYSVQEAINQAEQGSTIYVPAGTYLERIMVNKTVSIVGEDASTTVIDGSNAGTVLTITASNVCIANLTIRNSGWGWTRNGIYVYMADNCNIRNNILINNCHNIRLNHSRNSMVCRNTIKGNGYGIRFINAFNCTAAGNNVSDVIGGIHLQNATKCTAMNNRFTHNDQGIRLYSPCTFNTIFENSVAENTYDGMIEAMPGNTTFLLNAFFHNNFINNSNPFICRTSGHIWDNGYPSGGNYWSRYTAVDSYSGINQNSSGTDGIGDIPYTVAGSNKDRYPLVHPYGSISNLNTNRSYLTIQSAIDASETLDSHTINIRSGIYQENLNVPKAVRLIGESRLTILDGRKKSTTIRISSDNVTVTGFTIRNSGEALPPYGMHCGLLLDHVTGCSISHNAIVGNLIGLYLLFSQNNVIENNTVSSNTDRGLWLWYSGNNVLTGNRILNNSFNFGAFGGSFSDFNNNVDKSNTVDGKPVYYVIGASNQIYDQTDIGTLYLINSNKLTVRNLILTENGHGTFFYNASNLTIENVTASKNNYGIYLQECINCTVADSNCSSNWVGICLQDSRQITVENNTALGNEKGISLYEANNNLVVGNVLCGNLYGLRLFSSSFNEISHNNIIDNTIQEDSVNSYRNIWDDGIEGNFWSDYEGNDLSNPPDGIGDENLPWHGVDYYPSISPYWNPADVNHDLTIDIRDLARAALAFGSFQGHPRWNRQVDLNRDLKIDIKDIVMIARSFGCAYEAL